jgi:methanogenic corrinoid protein MtbC1
VKICSNYDKDTFLNENYVQAIGADGYAQNFSIAVEKAKEPIEI